MVNKFSKKHAIALLSLFLAGMGMFAIAESYGKPEHPIGRFTYFCYGNYTIFCLPIHLIAWLGSVLFFPVAIAGYVYRFSSSLDYYLAAILYWSVVFFLVTLVYSKKKKG